MDPSPSSAPASSPQTPYLSRTSTLINPPLPPSRLPPSSRSTPDECHPSRKAPNFLLRTIHGATWQAYPIGMGTAAVYICLFNMKWHPHWVTYIELVLFFFNIVLFVSNTALLILQAIIYPKQSKRLITCPRKGVFVPLIVLDFATLIVGTVNYAGSLGDTHPDLLYISFWVYLAFALVVCGAMNMIWFRKTHDIEGYTLAYAFLVFPLMLVGVVALNVLNVIPPEQSRGLPILILGYAFQGLGTCMTFMHISIYMFRITTLGYVRGHGANGAFIAPGPPGFTALVLLNLGRAAREILPLHSKLEQQFADAFYSFGIISSIFLMGFAVFLWFFAAGPYLFLVDKHPKDALAYFALTFPQVGWIVTLRGLGDIFESGIFWVAQTVFTVYMCVLWLVLISVATYACIRGDILISTPEECFEDPLPSYIARPSKIAHEDVEKRADRGMEEIEE